jgi:hypothetical protein
MPVCQCEFLAEAEWRDYYPKGDSDDYRRMHREYHERYMARVEAVANGAGAIISAAVELRLDWVEERLGRRPHGPVDAAIRAAFPKS